MMEMYFTTFMGKWESSRFYPPLPLLLWGLVFSSPLWHFQGSWDFNMLVGPLESVNWVLNQVLCLWGPVCQMVIRDVFVADC